MRKTAEIISLAALAVLALITINVFYGPHPLPARVPTHFDAAGRVNGWGSPASLLLLPVVAAGLYLLLTVIARFPAAFNYPVKVTEINRAQLEYLTLNLLAWIKAEMLVFFAGIDFLIIQAARNPERGFQPFPIYIFLGVLGVTIIGHMVPMFRAGSPRPQA
jgi:uncharacterized membrane protein